MALTKVIGDGVQGISNSSDATALEITSSEDIVIKHNTNNAKLVFNDQSNSSNFFIQQIGSSGSPALRFFESTGDERMRLHNGGILSVNQGIALGVGSNNTASNVLDDYEEGTWNLTDTSGAGLSITVYVATYTKIGNQVFFEFGIVFPTTSNGNDLKLSLPFTAKNSGDNTGGGGITVTNSGRTDTLVVIRNSNNMALQSVLNASASNANYSGKQLRASGQYTVA